MLTHLTDGRMSSVANITSTMKSLVSNKLWLHLPWFARIWRRVAPTSWTGSRDSSVNESNRRKFERSLAIPSGRRVNRNPHRTYFLSQVLPSHPPRIDSSTFIKRVMEFFDLVPGTGKVKRLRVTWIFCQWLTVCLVCPCDCTLNTNIPFEAKIRAVAVLATYGHGSHTEALKMLHLKLPLVRAVWIEDDYVCRLHATPYQPKHIVHLAVAFLQLALYAWDIHTFRLEARY